MRRDWKVRRISGAERSLARGSLWDKAYAGLLNKPIDHQRGSADKKKGQHNSTNKNKEQIVLVVVLVLVLHIHKEDPRKQKHLGKHIENRKIKTKRSPTKGHKKA